MSDDSRIDDILGEWRARRDAGESVSESEVIDAHPDLADSLRARFDALAAIAAAKSPTLRDVAAERYSDFRVLGQGGMGIVYWALDTDLNRQVAFKVVRPDAGQSGEPTPAAPIHLAPPPRDTPASQSFATLKARFLQEAWVTAGLEHPGIVPVYEVGQTLEGVPYYTMRFVKGSRMFSAAIQDVRGKPVEARLALIESFLKVCDTIRYAHAHGVVHRDLKPDNVALGEFGEVVVLDWGLAKMTGKPDAFAEAWKHRIQDYREASDLRTLANALGTPGYMSPEAALGRVDEVDARSDVYSLGAMLFEILTGRLPYEFATYAELAGKILREDAPRAADLDARVPQEISRICAAALARKRAARTSSVDALAADIRAWLSERERDAERSALVREAEAAREGIEETRGEETLRRVDHLQAVCARLLDADPASARGAELLRDADALQERAIVERESAARSRVARRAAVAGLGAAVVGAAVFAWFVSAEKRETERALVVAREERDAKLAALEEAQKARVQAEGERDAKLAALNDAQRARSQAEAERDEKTAALRRARVTGLTAAAEAAVERWPMRALLLAREAVRLDPGPKETDALRRAIFEALEVSVRTYDFQPNWAAVSPDGRRTVAAGWTRIAVVRGPEGGVVATLRGHDGPINTVAYSADGTRIVTASSDRTARVWDADGRQLAVLSGHNGPVNTAAFSSDGSRVVTASEDGTARIWSTDGKELAVLRTGGPPVASASFSPDGSQVVAGCNDRVARVFDLSGKELVKLAGHTNRVTWATYSPDGSRIVTAATDRTARIWDLSGKELALLRGHDHWVRSAEFSRDGARVVTASNDKTARVWSLDGTELAVLRGHEDAVRSAVFTPDGTRVVTAGADKTTRVWTLERREAGAIRQDGLPVAAAAVSPDGTLLVLGGDGGPGLMADAAGEQVTQLGTHKSAIRCVTFAKDGRFATVGVGGGVRICDRRGKVISSSIGHKDLVDCAEFSPDGSRLVTASEDRTARIWSAAGKELAVLSGHTGHVRTGAFAPDGAHVVTSSADGTARVWSCDGREEAVLRGHTGPVNDAEFSPDGTRIATASADRTVRVWDLAGKEILVLRGYEGTVFTSVWSADGERILTSSADYTARLWSKEGKELAVLRGHEGSVTSAVFSSDGRLVLTASEDNTARIWDLEGREVAVLRGHSSWVRVAAFFPDGSRVLTASADGTARIWYVAPADLLRLADERAIRGFTDEERRMYADLLGAK